VFSIDDFSRIAGIFVNIEVRNYRLWYRIIARTQKVTDVSRYEMLACLLAPNVSLTPILFPTSVEVA
jgi:hypothetical protein